MALKYALQSFPPIDQRRLVLFINDKLPLRTSKAHPHPGSLLCPLCQHDKEDTWHFLECSHADQHKKFTALKQNLTQFATTNNLHPCLFTTLWLGILAICNDSNYPEIHDDLPPVIQKAVHAQTRLGWDQLYQGCFSLHWVHAIDHLQPNLAPSG